MSLIFLFLPLLLGKVYSCKDGTYCSQLITQRFPLVSKTTKCAMWVYMLAPDLFPKEILKSGSNRTMTNVQCPKSCGCPKAVVVVVPVTVAPENRLQEIYQKNVDFKQLIGELAVNGLNVSTNDALERFQIFEKNKKVVDEHNKNFTLKLTSYKMALNLYSILKPEEIPPNGLQIDIPSTPLTKEQIDSAKRSRKKRQANSINWITNMRGVLDQKTCGGCWAFAMNGAVEGFLNISNVSIDDSLSVQQLLDCDRNINSNFNLGNKGCGGGYFQIAAEYFKTTGIASYVDYPFIVSSSGMCHSKVFPIAPKIKTFDSGFVVSNSSEQFEVLDNLMEKRLRIGPVAVGMAVTDDVYKYSEGIYEGPCGSSINHAVVIIGYTAEYWIIRNSWGTKWGEKGHIRVKRERKSDPCQLTRYWSQPIEVGSWIEPVIGPGETYIADEEQNPKGNVDCDGCEKCDDCDDDEDDEDDDYWTDNERDESSSETSTEGSTTEFSKVETPSTQSTTLSTKPSTLPTKLSTLPTKPSTLPTKPATLPTKSTTFSAQPTTFSATRTKGGASIQVKTREILERLKKNHQKNSKTKF